MARAQPVPYAKSSLKNTVLPPRNVNAGMCAREMRERDHERSLSSSPGIFKDNENHFSLEQINMQHTHTQTLSNMNGKATDTSSTLYIHSIRGLLFTWPLFGGMSAWRLLITVAVPGWFELISPSTP